MSSFDDALARAITFVRELAAGPAQFETLEHAIRVQAGRFPSSSHHISVRIPLLVHAAIRGDERPALDLAAAMLLLYMGTDLLDDLADGDLATEWRGENLSQIQLIAIGLFATLPQLILTRLDAPRHVIVELQRAVLEASVRMGDGQRLDILSRDSMQSDISLDRAWECIELKSGAAIGLFGRTSAILAGAPELADRYAAMGHALGCAYCVMKDCSNLSRGEGSSDLMNGTRSYPLVLYISGLRKESRGEFLELLRVARDDAAKRTEVLRRVTDAGIFQVAGLVIESCRQRAAAALEEARPLEPAASGLRHVVDFARQGAMTATR